jgi:hypothetical protein
MLESLFIAPSFLFKVIHLRFIPELSDQATGYEKA